MNIKRYIDMAVKKQLRKMFVDDTINEDYMALENAVNSLVKIIRNFDKKLLEEDVDKGIFEFGDIRGDSGRVVGNLYLMLQDFPKRNSCISRLNKAFSYAEEIKQDLRRLERAEGHSYSSVYPYLDGIFKGLNLLKNKCISM